MTAVLSQKPTQQPQQRKRGRWIDEWDPENAEFWARTGRRTAWRNLAVGVVAEHLAFNVWLLMSVIVVSLNSVGFDFTTGEKFLLVIVPNLVGAGLRIPYTFLFPRFGGRAWTAMAAGVLLVPCAMLAYAVTSHAPYWFFVVTAAVMGFGGASFSSSMANMSFFFPESRKGFALGLNAAGGNIGAAVAQLLVPVVISIGTGIHLAYAALFWMPFIVVAAACAWLFMNSLTMAKPDGHSYRHVLRDTHTWVTALLYVGSFGSFIGFSFAFPLLIGVSFPGYERFVGLAFLGALISASIRPLGGVLADKLSGARVAVVAFAGMAVGALGAVVALEQRAFWLFFASFILMFVTTGIGNGAIYRMIPHIFAAQARARAEAAGSCLTEAGREAKRQAAAVVGLTGSVGAFGGVLVNLIFKFSIDTAGTITPALLAFLVLYGVCIGATWWCYLRRSFAVERRPSLAYAQV